MVGALKGGAAGDQVIKEGTEGINVHRRADLPGPPCCLFGSHVAWGARAVSQRLGHSNPALTLKVYAHCLPSDDAQLAAGLARMMA
jgi:hypothetical protein